MNATTEEIKATKKATKHVKLVTLFVVFLVILSTLTVSTFVYWLYQPDDVLDIKNAPVPVRTIRSEAHPQGVVILKVDYCKNLHATGRVRTSFVSDSREVFLPIATDYQPPQCMNTELPIIVPEDLPPGEYHIHFRVTYDINPLKKGVPIEFDSLKFKVAE